MWYFHLDTFKIIIAYFSNFDNVNHRQTEAKSVIKILKLQKQCRQARSAYCTLQI
jgi:hypothetical protein